MKKHSLIMEFFHRLFSISKKNFLFGILFVAVFAFYTFTRVFLFAHEGAAGFGYDTGIYRYTINGYFERLHDKTAPPFGFSAYSNTLKALHVSTDSILIAWYFLLAFAVFFLFYFFVKTYTDAPTALLALFLFSLSTVQYEFFWWFYYRNFLAFVLFLVTLILLHRRSFLTILPLIAIGTVHVITLVPLGLTILILTILKKEDRKFYFFTGSIALFGVVLLNFKELLRYLPSVTQTGGRVQNLDPGMKEFTGQFVNFSFFWKHTILYMFFGILGVLYYAKKHLTPTILLGVSLIPVVAGILFYRRFFIFIDVFLIFFAAVFLWNFVKETQNKFIFAVLGLYVAIGMGVTGEYVVAKKPLLTAETLSEIQMTNSLAPSFLMSISSATAPWLYGFTHHRVIAPGLFEENKWNLAEWQEFWVTPDPNRRHELLKSYGKPLYVFLAPGDRGFEPVLLEDSHFVPKTQGIWEYVP